MSSIEAGLPRYRSCDEVGMIIVVEGPSAAGDCPGPLIWGVVNPLMRVVDNPVRSPMAGRGVGPSFALTPPGSPPGPSAKELDSDEHDPKPDGRRPRQGRVRRRPGPGPGRRRA